MDPNTANQVKAARARSNSWFSQVKQREARLQAAEDKALEKEEAKKERHDAKKEAKEAKRNSFFGSTLRRLSSGSRRDRRDSTSTVNSTNSLSTSLSGSTVVQSPRMTLNKNAKRKRTNISALKDTSLRRVCFQLDELVELRTYVQVEAEDREVLNENGSIPTVRDMTAINPYASSTPLDRADLYLQCCKVYRTTPHPTIVEQLRAKGPAHATWEGPRSLELRDLSLSPLCAMALGDCLGLPLTAKHLTEVVFDNCGLNDSTLQLLLSCLYGSGALERIEIKRNPDISKAGVRCALCFLCLSPQIRSFAWAGEQFDSEAARILTETLSDSKIRALRELAIEGARLSDEDFALLLPAAQRTGVYAYGFRGSQMSAVTLRRVAAMLSGRGAMHGLDLSRTNLDQGFGPLIDGLNTTSELISLHLEDCGLSTENLIRLLQKLATLPNFRRLVLDGHDLRPLVSTLTTELPKFSIIRRIGLARSSLENRDIVVLCEILAQANLSELRLSGVNLDASSLSALYALARVSKSLINLDIDIPHDAHGEKLGRRILAECIRNMETQEANTDFTETDIYASIVQQHQDLVNNKQEMDRHDELSRGAEGLISALDLHLDTTEDETAGDVPLAMLERARHIRNNIAPALAEPLSELQERRLQLVAATLDKVIRRFESTYPELRPKVLEQEQGDVYEHTGRARAEFVSANRHHPEAGIKSRQLEAEEGEIMKLANRMTDRLNILKSASNSATPSAGPSRGELQDKQEAEMLESISAADGDILKARLYELQQNGHNFDRRLGHPVA